MQPNTRLIHIPNGIELVPQLLSNLFIEPRKKAVEWSRITQQTPNMKVGYPGQHLVSLITGMPGERTGARGNDLIDGSEIKSCSRVDQVDECLICKNKVLRIESFCSVCGSLNIDRKNDSKWLFTIRSENDLKVLTEDVDRIVLVLADYPYFSQGIFDDIRFQIFEIWNNSPRCSKFKQLMKNYYENIYGTHKANNANKTPAPKNFWPNSYQFYLCNPIKIFSATVTNSITNPQITIDTYIPPDKDRSNMPSLLMPVELLKKNELIYLAENVPVDILKSNLICGCGDLPEDPLEILKKCSTINEQTRAFLPLREDTTFVIPDYNRRRY
jgi:hypothetical protein